MKTAERYEKVVERFKQEMPTPTTELNYENPYQLLVAVILSAQCTDKRINLVTPAFFEAFPTPQALAEATPEQVFDKIKSVSYPNNKTKSLLGMARKLVEDYDGNVPDDFDALLSLPGWDARPPMWCCRLSSTVPQWLSTPTYSAWPNA